jgi:hypothetical protein
MFEREVVKVTRSLMLNLSNLKQPAKTATFFVRCVVNFIYPEDGGRKFPRNGVCSEDGGGEFLRNVVLTYHTARRHISEDLGLIIRIFSV